MNWRINIQACAVRENCTCRTHSKEHIPLADLRNPRRPRDQSGYAGERNFGTFDASEVSINVIAGNACKPACNRQLRDTRKQGRNDGHTRLRFANRIAFGMHQ